MSLPLGFTPRWNDCYCIRLSYSYTQIPQMFWEWLGANLCEAVYATAHNDTETPHVHMALYNSRVSRDNVRKYIIKAVAEFIETAHPTGNALMSTKKWKGEDTYLIYLTKGTRHEVIANTWYESVMRPQPIVTHETYNNGENRIPMMFRREIVPRFLFTTIAIQAFRDQWKENESTASVEYKAWKADPTFPKCITVTRTVEEMTRDTQSGWLTKSEKPPFTQIRKSAIDFSLQYLKAPVIDAGVRFMAKNLVSNYCHYNDIIMLPLYI